MKTIRYTATLYYYDGPQVFEGRDDVGGHFIAVMAEPDGGHDQYLVVKVEPERLRQFRSGTLDLRSLLTEREKDEWFLAKTNGGFDTPLALQPQTTSLAATSYLPETGFLLHDPPVEVDTVLNHSALDFNCGPGAVKEMESPGKSLNQMNEYPLPGSDSFAFNWGVSYIIWHVPTGNPEVAIQIENGETRSALDLKASAEHTWHEVILTDDTAP